MSDILIRGYSMPNGCGVCPLNTGAFYCAGLKRYVIEEEHVWMGSNYRRLKDCPLRKLPKHGDLISADDVQHVLDNLLKRTDDDAAIVFLKWAKDCVRVLPKIVPSNKEDAG